MAKLPGVPLDDFERILKGNGYKYDRCNDGHAIYKKTITRTISVPNHKREVKGCLAKKIIKNYGLNTDVK